MAATGSSKASLEQQRSFSVPFCYRKHLRFFWGRTEDIDVRSENMKTLGCHGISEVKLDSWVVDPVMLPRRSPTACRAFGLRTWWTLRFPIIQNSQAKNRIESISQVYQKNHILTFPNKKEENPSCLGFPKKKKVQAFKVFPKSLWHLPSALDFCCAFGTPTATEPRSSRIPPAPAPAAPARRGWLGGATSCCACRPEDSNIHPTS